MIQWHLEVRALSQLKPHPKNPRTLSKAQYNNLKASLDNFGLIDKPIINLDNTIIGGHQRIEIYRNENAQYIQCWVPDRTLSEKEIDELNIRLNKNTGEFDWDILANQFELADLMEWGFTENDIDMPDMDLPNPKAEDEKEPEKITCPHCGKDI